MIETEIKAKVSDECLSYDCELMLNLLEKVRKMGFPTQSPVPIVDFYFDTPNGFFTTNDESLRVRSYNCIGGTYICHKGPKIDGKCREELDIEVIGPNGSQFTLLPKMGFKMIAKVSKTRVKAKHDNIEVCIDVVEDLGTYIEVEAMAENEIEMRTKLAYITSIIQELGYTELINDSYLEMVLKKNESEKNDN